MGNATEQTDCTHSMHLISLQAKKFMSDRSPQYMQARTCSKELADLISNLHRHSLHPSPLTAWEKWFSWERANPLRASDAILHSRIVFAFKQAITHLRHVPEIWQAYTSYLLSTDKFDEALSIAEQARSILPNRYSMLCNIKVLLLSLHIQTFWMPWMQRTALPSVELPLNPF